MTASSGALDCPVPPDGYQYCASQRELPGYARELPRRSQPHLITSCVTGSSPTQPCKNFMMHITHHTLENE